MKEEIPELTAADLASAMPARLRKRLMRGQFESGSDVAALRRFVRITQVQFATAMGISVHTLRNWEQDRRKPEGPAVALLRIASPSSHLAGEPEVRGVRPWRPATSLRSHSTCAYSSKAGAVVANGELVVTGEDAGGGAIDPVSWWGDKARNIVWTEAQEVSGEELVRPLT